MMDSVIVDLTNWIFEETNLKNMILLDAKLVFSFLIRFFDENGKLYLIILRNQYKIFHTSKKEKNINGNFEYYLF